MAATMTDTRQAVIDAINAIQQERLMYGQSAGSLPEGIFDVDVDPDLLEPKHWGVEDITDQDVDIQDPDNVLKDMEEKQQQQQQNDQEGNQQNQTQDSESSDSSDENDSGDSGDGGMPDFEDQDVDDDYVNAWNEIMDRFGNKETDIKELKKLLSDIKAGKIESV